MLQKQRKVRSFSCFIGLSPILIYQSYDKIPIVQVFYKKITVLGAKKAKKCVCH